MTLTNAYATLAEYRATSSLHASAGELAVTAALVSASRLIERGLGNHPRQRYFRKAESESARVFDGPGVPQLYIDDAATVTSVAVDTAGDGSFATTYTLAGHSWINEEPENRDTAAEPVTMLEVLPYAAAPFGAWPRGRRCLRVTATWGWPAIPVPIKKLTILIARQIVDLETAGIAQTVVALDDSVLQLAPGAPTLLRDIRTRYSRRLPSVEAV